MRLFCAGATTVIFFVLGMYLHDFQVSRKTELVFFGLAATCYMIFQWLLYKTH